MIRALAVLCAALACASAMDTAPYTSTQWQSAGRAPRGATHCVNLVLQHTPEALTALDAEFWAVSNPQHSKYGQYHTPQSLAALMAMPQARVDAVRNWIATRLDTRLDVPRVTLAEPSRDRISACMSVPQAEHVFGTELHTFVNAKGHSARRVVRAATRIDMPQHIADHIAYAVGLNAPIVTHEARAAKRVAPVVDPNTRKVVGVQAGAALGDTSTAPILTLAYGGNDLMTIGFMIRCANGTTNIDSDPTKPPCITRGPAVDSFTVSITPVSGGYQPFTRTIALAQVTRGWDGSGAYHHNNNATFAYVNVEVRKYVGYNVQIQTNFVGGVVSPWSGMNDFPVYCTDYVTPTFLKQLYGIPSGLQVKNAASTISVAEFGQQYYSDADLQAYLSAMGMPAPKPVTVIGPNNQSNVGGEAQLDIQVVMAIAVAAPTTFWSVDSSPTANEPFDLWLQALLNDANVPLVHSVSYADAEETLQKPYMDGLNTAFQQAGTRGISLLFASGDDGVASYLGRGDDVPHWCQAAHPEFPSCSPFITSVGGTQLSMNSAPACTGTNVRGVTVGCTGAVETVCSASLGGVITSGGGFSNTYEAPDYQTTVVQAYLNNARVTKPPANFFNAGGRGYPDVAGMAAAYLVMMNGELVPESGTSASTPLWASMVTLWNDIRLSSGQPSLGFLNPWLYQLAAAHPEVFNDVVTGDNRCLVNGYECCANGFNAAPGWDPTTGLGSPKFLEIANLVLNPDAQFSFVTAATTAEAEKEKKAALVISIIALILSTLAVFGLCVVRRGIQKDTALLGNSH